MKDLQEKYARLVSKIIAVMEEGTIPWTRRWCRPRNAFSGRSYRGINTLILMASGSVNWGTYKQVAKACYRDNAKWLEEVHPTCTIVDETTHRRRKWQYGDPLPKGCKYPYGVKAGTHGETIVFWKWIPVVDTDKKIGEETQRKMPIMRLYTVFDLDNSCTLPDNVKEAISNNKLHDVATSPEELLCASDLPKFKSNESRAAYSPIRDTVYMPNKAAFTSDSEYYSTYFHEYIHSTGHSRRLKREFGLTMMDTEKYGEEELVAELGACFMCSEAGLTKVPKLLESQAAYLQHWLSVIKQDPKVLVQAASKAQKAVDYLMAITYTSDKEE